MTFHLLSLLGHYRARHARRRAYQPPPNLDYRRLLAARGHSGALLVLCFMLQFFCYLLISSTCNCTLPVALYFIKSYPIIEKFGIISLRLFISNGTYLHLSLKTLPSRVLQTSSQISELREAFFTCDYIYSYNVVVSSFPIFPTGATTIYAVV